MKSIQFQLLLLFLSCLLFFFPGICVEGAKEGLILWSGTIVPTLLPFLLLTGLMNKYQALHLVSMIFYPIYRKFPDLNRNLAYTLILGFFCGYPLGAKIISDQVFSGSCTKKEGQCLLAVCNNVSPMFTIGYTLHLILESRVSAPLFFLCLYAPGILYLLWNFLRFYRQGFFTSHPHHPGFFSRKSVEEIMFDSLRSVFVIGIYIMIFSIGANLLLSLPSMPPIDFLIGCLEITTGITHLGSLPLSLSQKCAALCAVSSFGGLCSAAQTASVSRESHLSMPRYLVTKAVFACLSGCLALVLF